jgi:hypothetical protein
MLCTSARWERVEVEDAKPSSTQTTLSRRNRRRGIGGTGG